MATVSLVNKTDKNRKEREGFVVAKARSKWVLENGPREKPHNGNGNGSREADENVGIGILVCALSDKRPMADEIKPKRVADEIRDVRMQGFKGHSS
jgi:hypothetical protein